MRRAFLAALAVPSLGFALSLPARAAPSAELLLGFVGNWSSSDPGCPSPLSIRFLPAELGLFVQGACAPERGACPLTPWAPENGASYAELFVDIDRGEVVNEEAGAVHRFVASSRGESGLSLDWQVESGARPVRRLVTKLDRSAEGIRLDYDRRIDEAFGPLRRACEYRALSAPAPARD